MEKTHKLKREPGQTAQDALDSFWETFSTKAPGKVTSVLPNGKHKATPAAGAGGTKSKPNKGSSPPSNTMKTYPTYEEAAAACIAEVESICAECKRVNTKFTDLDFDLAKFNSGVRDTLGSLDNAAPPPPGKEDENSGGKDSFQPQAVKRVPEIFENPQFYIDGPTANDVRQGHDVKDCWLMAGLCTVSNKPGLIERICAARKPEVGLYGFVFHRDGEWFHVVVDDKLYLTSPDYDDDNTTERDVFNYGRSDREDPGEAYRKIYQTGSGALYFAQCKHQSETWLPLLQKAYGKAHGDYSSIEEGWVGEGIEDLCGGITTEIDASDILDKDKFWSELLRVNKDFLFGCATGLEGRGTGEREGIIEGHAYSVMRAVEIDGKRLCLLKNPWGKGEWKGAWSDGSKEWTPEWMEKLGHRFGDDGSFYIQYSDLLCKYQAFDRTRLFGKEWRMRNIWTTLNVPWMHDYHDTYFYFELTRSGPVVVVLSQLDDRYFRGLEGQYSFTLSFRIHRAGSGPGEYEVRSQTGYRLRRSVSVELELGAGAYEVYVRVDAMRNELVLPAEKVVQKYARTRREKLTLMGRAYDFAHAKGEIIETPAEKKQRQAWEARKKQKETEKFKQEMMEEKKAGHALRRYKYKKMLRKYRKEKAHQERMQHENIQISAPPSLSHTPVDSDQHTPDEQCKEPETKACQEEMANATVPAPAAPAAANSTIDSTPSPSFHSVVSTSKPPNVDLVEPGPASTEQPGGRKISDPELIEKEAPATETSVEATKDATDTPLSNTPDSSHRKGDGEGDKTPLPPSQLETAADKVEQEKEQDRLQEVESLKTTVRQLEKDTSGEEINKDTADARHSKPCAEESNKPGECIQKAMPDAAGRGPDPPGDTSLFGSRHRSPPKPSPPSSVSSIPDSEVLRGMRMKAGGFMGPRALCVGPARPGVMNGNQQHDNEDDEDPWNAVVVVGLRVYVDTNNMKIEKEEELVKLSVIRPNIYEDSSEDEDNDEEDSSEDEDNDEEDSSDDEDENEPKDKGVDKDLKARTAERN